METEKIPLKSYLEFFKQTEGNRTLRVLCKMERFRLFIQELENAKKTENGDEIRKGVVQFCEKYLALLRGVSFPLAIPEGGNITYEIAVKAIVEYCVPIAEAMDSHPKTTERNFVAQLREKETQALKEYEKSATDRSEAVSGRILHTLCPPDFTPDPAFMPARAGVDTVVSPSTESSTVGTVPVSTSVEPSAADSVVPPIVPFSAATSPDVTTAPAAGTIAPISLRLGDPPKDLVAAVVPPGPEEEALADTELHLPHHPAAGPIEQKAPDELETMTKAALESIRAGLDAAYDALLPHLPDGTYEATALSGRLVEEISKAEGAEGPVTKFLARYINIEGQSAIAFLSSKVEEDVRMKKMEMEAKKAVSDQFKILATRGDVPHANLETALFSTEIALRRRVETRSQVPEIRPLSYFYGPNWENIGVPSEAVKVLLRPLVAAHLATLAPLSPPPSRRNGPGSAVMIERPQVTTTNVAPSEPATTVTVRRTSHNRLLQALAAVGVAGVVAGGAYFASRGNNATGETASSDVSASAASATPEVKKRLESLEERKAFALETIKQMGRNATKITHPQLKVRVMGILGKFASPANTEAKKKLFALLEKSDTSHTEGELQATITALIKTDMKVYFMSIDTMSEFNLPLEKVDETIDSL